MYMYVLCVMCYVLCYRWIVDGFETAGATGEYSFSPYTLLVGVALSDYRLPNTGNICLYPDSHICLREFFKTQVRMWRILFVIIIMFSQLC